MVYHVPPFLANEICVDTLLDRGYIKGDRSIYDKDIYSDNRVLT